MGREMQNNAATATRYKSQNCEDRTNKSICLPNSSYEPLAHEYYDLTHKTSRNFDESTRIFFKKHRSEIDIPPIGLVLDLGAGKGHVIEYCGVDKSRVIQVDISRTILSIFDREPCLQRIAGDALRLPFSSSSFSVVSAFLFDPFNIQDEYGDLHLFKQIFDVLDVGGLFIGTLPHIIWGKVLRHLRSHDEQEAVFSLSSGEFLSRTSILMDDIDIIEAIDCAGFSHIGLYDITIPNGIPLRGISPDIIDPACRMGLDPYCLPIIKVILAKKL